MGNVSQVMPSPHPTIGLGGTALPHTSGFTAATVGPTADRAVLDAALALARTAADLAAYPGRRAEVIRAHRARPAGGEAVPATEGAREARSASEVPA
ncbi:hypothetical protein [Streptomyces mexicanus]|uniref:hypothetical protein n=1 Tax=Streptomyces mexicanus TaxID=178566 RepID=UPI0031EFE4C9